MKVLGHKEYAIKDLRLPGHWREVLASPEAKRKAETIGKVGILQDPMVRKSDGLLVFGTTRVAGCVIRKIEKLTVKLIDCSDLEVEIIRRIENGDRNHDTVAQRQAMLELVELMTQEEMERKPEELPQPKKGRAKSPRGRARDKVAAELGIRPESVRQAERRQRIRKEKGTNDSPKEPAQVIESLGMDPLDETFVAQVKEIQSFLLEASGRLATAQSSLTLMANRKLPVNDVRVNRIKDSLSELASALRGLVPISLCPYCRGIDEVQKQCVSCAGTGYVTKDQEKGIPLEYWDEQKPIVLFNGEKRPLSDFLAPSDEAAEPPPDDEVDPLDDPGDGDMEPDDIESDPAQPAPGDAW